MPMLQDWIPQGPTTQGPTNQGPTNQGPANLDAVTPLKARACDALQAVLRGRRRPVATEVRLMRRGAERC